MSDLTPSTYPVTFTFDPPERIARWRPLVQWLLAIPHFIVLYILGIIAEILTVVSWIVGVITGKIPEGLQTPIAMYVRYNTRVFTYLTFLRPEYPSFSFVAQFADDGVDPRVRLDITPEIEGRSRLTIFFRGLLIIPQFIVLAVVAIALYVVMIISFFAVIILGRWPVGLRNFVVGFQRWSVRVSAYLFLLTDKYPPFSFE